MAGPFDILIVGAGSAGCVLAARLSERAHLRVGLLEAGGPADDPDIADPSRWPFLGGKPYDWAYRTVPQPGTAGRVHDWPRGRLLGGSSSLNAMAHVRGHPDDFAAWAEAVGPAWSHASLLPAFRRSEVFSFGASAVRGGEGPLPVFLPEAEVHPLVRAYIEAAASIGAPRLAGHNEGPLAGVAPNQLTIRAGRRVTAADAYLTAAVLARPNLSLLTGLTAERLLFDGRRVVALLGIDEGGVPQRIEAGRIVLAAGAIGSPLLLMRSGIGDPDELEVVGVVPFVERRQVGRNLHDHLLAAGLVYEAREPIALSRLQHSESLAYLHGDDPGRREGAPDAVVACVTLPVASERFIRPEAGRAFTLMAGFCHPESRGTIRLGGPLAADPPRIDPAYLSTAGDRAAFRRSFRLARRIGEAAPLDPWRGAELHPGPACRSDAEIDAFLAEAAITHHHPVGTCRMGLDGGSVVDERLRVRGVEGLAIVDASVIPRITSGPVNAAVVAIAEHWAATMATDDSGGNDPLGGRPSTNAAPSRPAK